MFLTLYPTGKYQESRVFFAFFLILMSKLICEDFTILIGTSFIQLDFGFIMYICLYYKKISPPTPPPCYELRGGGGGGGGGGLL